MFGRPTLPVGFMSNMMTHPVVRRFRLDDCVYSAEQITEADKKGGVWYFIQHQHLKTNLNKAWWYFLPLSSTVSLSIILKIDSQMYKQRFFNFF